MTKSSANQTEEALSVMVADQLPYLRRYARALSGSQQSGDRYAAATLEALLYDRSVFDEGHSQKVALFKAFHAIWKATGAWGEFDEVAEIDSGIVARAHKHLSKLTANTREILLLRTIERFTPEDVAAIVSLSVEEVNELYDKALADMQDSVSGKVLVIEDETIIALDLESIVAETGHKVTGVAPTHKSAMDLFARERPDLILSDIRLADGSSGIDAVNEILQTSGDVPVIFITAYPEELLTGERPEPAFVITKPYSEEQVRSAVSQAMFFTSTETLDARYEGEEGREAPTIG
ncbi:Response regulator receiver domain-containing protein [Salinihabitans flavidus]|uniref:Response regulator receiver domain-containing protein n=1 Tax=Salinihabitans flavidus TaxID=569882 RepID=A0A1H8VQ51_9RHOB|nr:response regulator [Salinihabitans flavidus]SEP17552.1 Response regulator receiver domain-containing protein [Salinihabitans flavidus]